ncbi:hypothetical protein [Thalassospira sp. MIT1370]|uniref:hypothetical protein n=1 Tax=unclassified Thalassospira TaxID=2648997 RepID=UPI00399B5FBE
MKNNERLFYIFECEVASKSSGAVLPTITDLAQIWKKHFEDDVASVPIRKASAHLLVGDIDADHGKNKDTISVLIRLSDTEAPNVVYSDIPNKKYIEHQKSGTEGYEVGAHFIISTLPEKGKPNTYLAILESVPGLNYREVRRALNKILHNQYDRDPTPFEYVDPFGRRTKDGAPKLIKHLPRLDFRGLPSENLINDINRGNISEITLIKTEQKTPVGGVSYLKKEETNVRISVDNKNKSQNAWDDIKSAMLSQHKAFPTSKISFKLPDQKRSVTVNIENKSGVPIDDIYIKSFRIDKIYPLLASSSRSLVKHLIEKARPRLIEERNT